MNKRRLFRDMRPDFQVELREVIPQILEACFYFAVFAICSNAFAASPTIVSFTGGQVTPHLESRPDFQKYATASRTMENFLPAIQGPAVRRSGTRFVAGVKIADGTVRPPAAGSPVIGISTAEELALVGTTVGGDWPRDGDYELLNDIDISAINWVPIGITFAARFTGTFDGRFFTISNLTQNKTSPFDWATGLFNFISDGNIIRVILTNANITMLRATTLTDCGLLASLGGSLGGASNFTITDCHVQGTITGATQEIGTVNNGVTQCGGLLGGRLGQGAVITRCSADVVITGFRRMIYAGGLVGRIDGFGTATIIDCYATGSIVNPTSGTNVEMNNIGGLVGNSTFYNSKKTIITNCYSAMNIQGKQGFTPPDIGGFTGKIVDFGLAGAADEDFNDCFWDNDLDFNITGHTADLFDCGGLASVDEEGDVDGITLSGTTAMQQQATFTNWDFDDVWFIDEGNDYPKHQWVRDAALIGEPTSNEVIRLIPFTVSTDDSYALEFGNQYMRFFRDSELD